MAEWTVPITLNGNAIGMARFVYRGDIERGFLDADCVLAPATQGSEDGSDKQVVELNMFPATMHAAVSNALERQAKEFEAKEA